jgi:antirestriction protein ArdC
MARDIYAEVTDKIIAAIEAGTMPWTRPWKPGDPSAAGLPTNYATGRAYHGINVPLLWASGFTDQRWMTYKQAQAIGANVRKGERGSLVVFFKPWTLRDVNAAGETVDRSIPVIRNFVVFNVAQIENLPADVAPAEPQPITYTRAAEMMTLAVVGHGGDRAFYAPSRDMIQLPRLEQFSTEADYHATALHELTHWTGHESRCAREFGKRFGDDAYAVEELVAEMGAAFLCAQAGIAYQTQHAAYIASWLKVLRADKKAIVHAASKAQAAADYVTGKLGVTRADDSEDEAVLCA